MVFLQIDLMKLYYEKGFTVFVNSIIDNAVLRPPGVETFERYFKLKISRK